MMAQERIKGLFWIWVFKHFQRCLAGKFSSNNYHDYYNHPFDRVRLGQFPLQESSSWRFWGRATTASTQQSSTQRYYTPFRDLPAAFSARAASLHTHTTAAAITATTPHETFSQWRRDYDDDWDEEYAEYYDEDDDSIFHIEDGIVTTRRNPSKSQTATHSTAASVKLRRFTSKQQPLPTTTTRTVEGITDDIRALTQPIVPISVNMEDQTGQEFANSDTMDLLADSGLQLARLDQSDWIEWKVHDSTKKLLKDHTERELLEQGEVLVYVGTAKSEGHGSHLPIIKTKALLPLSAHDMANLLMDSSKVQIYNKMSLGRKDVQILAEGTKIVTNLTKPPIAKSSMVSCTLMHSRKLSTASTLQTKKQCAQTAATAEETPHSTYLVVSRAVPGMIDDDLKDLPRNDILLGVNLLEDVGPNQCIMTAVTHVYSPALPTLLAKSMGVSSAINFVRDIRSACSSNAEK